MKVEGRGTMKQMELYRTSQCREMQGRQTAYVATVLLTRSLYAFGLCSEMARHLLESELPIVTSLINYSERLLFDDLSS